MYTLIPVYVHYFNRSIDLTINFHTNPYNLFPVGFRDSGHPVLKQICKYYYTAYYLARLGCNTPITLVTHCNKIKCENAPFNLKVNLYIIRPSTLFLVL